VAVDRRYQVFVSSTYRDLLEERQEIMQALLELDCIPAGMELFPAANDDQWTLIKRVIDDCDYYIVVIAGRYGSVSSIGLSYTEMEYRYALEIGKPIIGFVHKDIGKIPAERFETDPDKKAKLEAFRLLVQEKLVRYWETPAELGSVVSRSIIKLIKDYPAVGWIRGDNLATDTAREEILKLKNNIEELESRVVSSVKIDPESFSLLARGDDIHEFPAVLTVSRDEVRRRRYNWGCDASWGGIFYKISPLLIDEGSNHQILEALSKYFREIESKNIESYMEENNYNYVGFSSTDEAVNMIIVQFNALGLMEKGLKRRPIQDKSNYWRLTSTGEKYMYELRAVKRSSLLD
jgi:hypothetical protein